MRRAVSIALLLALISPALAAPKPLIFGADYVPYKLRVTLHFPEAAERISESQCSPAQVELFRAFFAGYLGDAAPRLAKDYESAHGGAGKPGTVIGLDFTAGCMAAGGALITRYLPDQNWATMFYDPAIKRWRIVG